MNKYVGLECPVCGKKFTENDDIAVCPDCGAPHHRECFLTLGHCAHQDAHGTEQQWEMPEPFDAAAAVAPEINIRCKRCGSLLEAGDRFCQHCGLPVQPDKPEASPELSDAPDCQARLNISRFFDANSIDPNEEIDGMKAEEIAKFTASNALRYLRVFRRQVSKGSIFGWNWAAFLIPAYWLFGRKCYRAGAIAAFFTLLSSTLIYAMGFTQSYITNSTATVEEALNFFSSRQFIAFGIISFVTLLFRVAMGLFGDAIYRVKVKQGIMALREKEDLSDIDFVRAGNLSIMSGAIAYVVIQIIATVIEVIVS